MQFDQSFIQDIKTIWHGARNKAYTLVNRAMIDAYWDMGRRIVEEEQKGYHRAEYGGFLLKALASQLTLQLDKALDERELRRIRQFYQLFPDRGDLRAELTWTHYRYLLRIENPRARAYYLREAAEQSWGTRELDRNIQSGYYERLVISRQPPTDQGTDPPNSLVTPGHLIKDPYILEFLGANVPPGFSENDLETAILANLQHFLLEMGNGFAFVARQMCIKTDTRRYYLDLVFYNYILKCFTICDLKIGELSHQDIGQMDMYLRMFDDLKKLPADNPTIGIILCTEKDDTLVKYSVLDENKQLFASRYKLFLPSEDELSRELRKLNPSI
jgi:predicted nuclease of restriction endonuclease-like (RecB) superfamily